VTESVLTGNETMNRWGRTVICLGTVIITAAPFLIGFLPALNG